MRFHHHRFQFILIPLILLVVSAAGNAQNRLFWDFPEPIVSAEGGRFPQMFAAGDQVVLIWQEFQGQKESLEATVSVKAVFSPDGVRWDSPVLTVAENLPYLWLEEVPLYSAAVDEEGALVVVVTLAGEGVALYRQTEPGPAAPFLQSAFIPSAPDAADVAIAPRLASVDGGLRLFLTRRTEIQDALRPTTLTIFLTSSENGTDWPEPQLFINPQADRALDGAVLEQNFLPFHLVQGNREFVAFQSLRQGEEGQVYQIYVKARSETGEWGPAMPVTESLTGSQDAENPLLWDNQRPAMGLSAEGDILLVWERRRGVGRPGVALTRLDPDGRVIPGLVEEVTGADNPYASAFPSMLNIHGETWVLWFDNTGIRMARRHSSYDYEVQATSLDAQSPGADRGSVSFPRALVFRNETYLVWQDRTAGLGRTIFLRPDIQVDSPLLATANFTSGRPDRKRTLTVNWRPPQDSSGILSHSWRWSRNPNDLPSREEADQAYGTPRAVFEITDQENQEGNWYFALIARDQAGNWSEPLRLLYTLDLTPPPPPVVDTPDTDANGFLVSNTFSLGWSDAEKEAAEYYRWRLDYLAASPESVDLSTLEGLALNDSRTAFARSEGTASADRQTSWVNLDNGVWAFSVTAVDVAGNEGLPSTHILLANRYRPVTFITGITSSRDEEDRIFLRIAGRGFLLGGRLTQAIIDEDGQAPWDYVYTASDGRLDVVSDRIADVVGIDDMKQGVYRVGVIHPQRGVVFWNREISLDATGNVKFGPFGLHEYTSLWEPAALSLRMSGNQLLLAMLVLLIFSAAVITFTRLLGIVREFQILQYNARAVMIRAPMKTAAQNEAALVLRRKGMGLRNKFTLALSLLVIFTITMIAAVLGFVWLRMERDTLAEGLENESRLLVDTLSSSARTAIPAADRGELLLLPDRISALSDALWTVVTGPLGEVTNGVLRATSEGYEYIWASNDPEVLDKISLPGVLDSSALDLMRNVADSEEMAILESAYPPENGGRLNSDGVGENRATLVALLRRSNIMPNQVSIGAHRITDAISPAIEAMRNEVEVAAQEAGIARMISELTVLEQQYAEVAQEVVLTLDFDNPNYLEAESAVAAQKKEIETLLLELSNSQFAAYPAFNADTLRAGGSDVFVFYKPILYRVGEQDANFFRGTVRLAVSVADIKNSLARVQQRIIIITVIASIASLAAGIVVAVFIASLIVRPITSLVKEVSIIRDQPDMLQHEDFDVSLTTGDELASLADTINGMVRGLVQAAIEQKELVAGQEIQKTFLPLEQDENSGKKLSTGGASNAFFQLFGYYEGADAVSGDYFDFRQLDDDHYVMIKLDIAGHGVTASLIMVQIAALYVDYFRKIREQAKESGRLSYNLRGFTFGINDLINEIGFKGRFAAFNLSVINVRTAEYEMIHAGDNLVHIFDGETRKMKLIEIPESPAAGQIESMLIEMNPTMYKEVRGSLKRKDILFLYTDGIEEAHHIIRDKSFNAVEYQNLPEEVKQHDTSFIESGYKPIDEVQDNEEFDQIRIDMVIEAAMNRQPYVLERRCDLTIGKPLHFDFTQLSGSCQDAVLALASVEKVFRLVPDGSGGSTSRVRVDRKIADFLRSYFAEYDEFYGHPVDEDAGYIYFSHLKEDPQDDDLTLWAYERL